jgi:hypothetical protein
MKSTLKASRDKLKQMFSQHMRPTDAATTEAPEPISVGPEPTDPPPFDEQALTEEVAKQLGWNVGDEAPGRVINKQMINKHFVWAMVDGWSEPVKASVGDREEWPAGSPIMCYYKGADADGCLVFNTRVRGPRWKRRAI